jgi:hypothetical protein
VALDDKDGKRRREASLRRRGEHRHRRRLRVTFVLGGREQVGFTIDVSHTGLFVAATHLPAPGSLVDLNVEEPGHRTHGLRGRVTWLREPPPQIATLVRRGFGVRLLAPPEAWTALIASIKRPAR